MLYSSITKHWFLPPAKEIMESTTLYLPLLVFTTRSLKKNGIDHRCIPPSVREWHPRPHHKGLAIIARR